MMKILVPIDGADASQRTIDHVIATMASAREGGEVHLLNVQPPLPFGSRVSSVVGHDKVEDYHREEGLKALAGAQGRLKAAGVEYHCHIAVGDPAEVIVQYAKQHALDQIIMGTHGHSGIVGRLMGSVAEKVLAKSHVPVVLVK